MICSRRKSRKLNEEEKQKNVTENKCIQAETEAREKIETEWKEKLAERQESGEAIGELTMENMHIAMDEEAKKVRQEIMNEAKKVWAKEDYLAEEKEQQARIKMLEQQKKMEE